MADTTTVFQSGNSQAVRLPKEFRFKSKTVEIFRRGDEVVLREKPRTLGEVLRENGFDALGPPSARELDDHDKMMAAIRAPQPPDRRAWDALWGPNVVPLDAEPPGHASPVRKTRQR
jgi:virulence-associated protein VagC